jgi:hypothetical protein
LAREGFSSCARRAVFAFAALDAGSADFFFGLLRVADRLVKDHDSYPASLPPVSASAADPNKKSPPRYLMKNIPYPWWQGL